ncbi:DUF3043 domain-containing protein [Occultella glacieicola]|uniref:DUF3043 domain-containing protein n=1 Tax=Occultella glacieicola TaxID=2518684 RepID=A0ABY2DXV7_9MICO|nr:DUF3043 domain-containing protein [Occultella glacieicola]TDE88973.1 DUF3043 domain-containing protein [Occultella glacieicola]
MFGRKKDEAAPIVEEEVPRAGKGRPTPKRKDAEAANKRPLVPTDRGAARKVQREKMNAQRARMNEAMITGKEEDLPLQHRGPVRRYVRDYVDARFSLGELFLPLSGAIVVILLISTFNASWAAIGITAIFALYLIVAVALVDALICAFRVRRKLREKFGEERAKRTIMYTVMRAFQLRRTRLPKPQVKRGEYPR